jgi:hypothetical protein
MENTKKELTYEERKKACANCGHRKADLYKPCEKCGSSLIYNDPNPAGLIRAMSQL